MSNACDLDYLSLEPHRFSDCPRARSVTKGATGAANSLVIAETLLESS